MRFYKFSRVASEFIVNTTLSTLTAAGVMGILRLSDPRATAAAVFTGDIACGIFCLIAEEVFTFNDQSRFFLWAGICGFHYYFGKMAGQKVDPQFAYVQTAISLGLVAGAFFGMAKVLGIEAV